MRRRRRPRASGISIVPPATKETRAIETAPSPPPEAAKQQALTPSQAPGPPRSAKPNALLGFGPQRVSRRSLFSPGLVADARAYFEARLDRPVSDDEARKFLGDLADYFLAFKSRSSCHEETYDD